MRIPVHKNRFDTSKPIKYYKKKEIDKEKILREIPKNRKIMIKSNLDFKI